MKNLLAATVVLGLATGMAATAQAQIAAGRSHFGPQIGYNFDAEALVLGAQFSAPIGRHLEIYPSFNIFLVDVGSAFALNLDLKYRIPIQNADWFYVGGGLNVTRFACCGGSNTEPGLNLLGGIESRRGNIHPFGEVRLTIGDGSSAQIVGGLNFTIGRH